MSEKFAEIYVEDAQNYSELNELFSNAEVLEVLEKAINTTLLKNKW